MFFLASQGNPNILDFILCKKSCIIYSDDTGDEISNFGQNFISKQSVSRFLGFAKNHLRSMDGRRKSGIYPEKRKHLFEAYGFDCKDAGHILRCLLSLQDMLINHNYEIDKHSDIVRDVRNGKYSFEWVVEWTNTQEQKIKQLEQTSTLREHPDHDLIRSKLVELLEKYWSKNVVDIPI